MVEITEKRPEKGSYLPVNVEQDLQKFYMNEKLAPIADRCRKHAKP